MSDEIYPAILEARASRIACGCVTVATTSGSVPRVAGAKMLVYLDGRTIGTIGGGKLEALAVTATLQAIAEGRPLLKTYPLREDLSDSFGAICGGEVTLFIEPIAQKEAIFLIGAGHCARAIAQLAVDCGFHVSVVDERTDELALCAAAQVKISTPAADFIRSRSWQPNEALILVSRHFVGDQEALFAALGHALPGYVGMIGSNRKVLRVFDEMRKRGIDPARLATVFSPIGLDIGADSPIEIAVSVLAEIMQVLRGRPGSHLSLSRPAQ